MQYIHPEDGDKPCYCPACGWRGVLHQTDEYTPTNADFEPQEPVQVCPKCSDETPVQPLQQPAVAR